MASKPNEVAKRVGVTVLGLPLSGGSVSMMVGSVIAEEIRAPKAQGSTGAGGLNRYQIDP